MSVNPQMMAQMLMQQGGGGGGSTAGGAVSGLMNGSSNMMQKIMMIQALKNAQNPQQQLPSQAGQPPNPTTMGAPGLPGQALPQSMNQFPIPGSDNA